MSTPQPPSLKKRKLNSEAKRKNDLEKRRQRIEQAQFLYHQKIQKRLHNINYVQELGFDQNQATFCQDIIDIGKDVELGTQMVLANNTTKASISAFKLKQCMQKIGRFFEIDPEDYIEFIVYKRMLKCEPGSFQRGKQQQTRKSEMELYFAVFTYFYGQFNWYWDWKRVKSDCPSLLGIPIDKCDYIQTCGNPIIQRAQETFISLLDIKSSLALSELKTRFKKRRQHSYEVIWPRHFGYVRDIIEKKEKEEKESENGLKEKGYVFRMLNALIKKKKLEKKIVETLPISTNNTVNKILEHYAHRASRRVIIMSMHQLLPRQLQRINDANKNQNDESGDKNDENANENDETGNESDES